MAELTKNIASSSNGRTAAFEAVYLGSNPSEASNEAKQNAGAEDRMRSLPRQSECECGES